MAHVKELKEAVSFICSLANSIGKMAEKGQPTLADMMHLAPLMYKIPSAVDGIGEIPAELKSMSAAELDGLVQSIKDELDLPQDKVEKAIEDGVDIAVKLYLLAEKLRA